MALFNLSHCHQQEKSTEHRLFRSFRPLNPKNATTGCCWCSQLSSAQRQAENRGDHMINKRMSPDSLASSCTWSHAGRLPWSPLKSIDATSSCDLLLLHLPLCLHTDSYSKLLFGNGSELREGAAQARTWEKKEQGHFCFSGNLWGFAMASNRMLNTQMEKLNCFLFRDPLFM